VTLKKQQLIRRSSGFTLIEVLVALVVMTVGMLGVAVLYVEGLRLNRTAIYRTSAVTLASDMAERIRANQDNLISYTGDGPGQNRNCQNTPQGDTCSGNDMALDDWYRWRDSLNDALPAGAQATVDVQPAGAALNRVDIRIQWPEVGAEDPVSYTLSVYL